MRKNLKYYFYCAAMIFFSGKAVFSEEAPQKNVPAISDADSFIISNHYVHKWLQLPQLSGEDLTSGRFQQKPVYGIADVVIFIASYCVPCQQLTRYLLDLEKKYKRNNVRFTWVFSQDLKKDAVGFSREYGLKKAVIADDEAMKLWKNPRLPGVFLGDRFGWLLAMFPAATPQDVRRLDDLLSNITSY
ncbi:MAG: TlpA family protein disulfide reductase [Deltaproteobacteria bacterium]|nr:TlpA family protein disulfide reductase [Deltaproteobacteria bacterium]